MIDHYDWAGGREAMLRFGPQTGPVVIAALPLFEEANRTRALMATILRALADRGIGSVLPDLPGQGESLVPLQEVALLDMRDAYQALSEQLGCARVYGVAIRSGALLDTLALLDGRWHLAPQDGLTLTRELKRLRAMGRRMTERETDDWWVADEPLEVAGNLIGSTMLGALHGSSPFSPTGGAEMRVVRLDSDAQPADHKVAGRPLWRSAEPDNDPALAHVLADDIAQWVRACVG